MLATRFFAYRAGTSRNFAAFADKRGLGIGDVLRDDIVDFLGSLYRQGLDSRSVARHLVTIRHFYRFALTEGLVNDDPAANVESPKFRQSLPEFLSLEEVDRLLNQPDATSLIGLRDRAMIELMYSTGVRVSRAFADAARVRPADGSGVSSLHRQGEQGAPRARGPPGARNSYRSTFERGTPKVAAEERVARPFPESKRA